MSNDDTPATVRGSDSSAGVGGWISCADRMPDDGQAVAFVVRASNRLEYMNGRVLGGMYSAQKYSGGFSVPGLVVDAWYWIPLPEAPAVPPNARLEPQASTQRKEGAMYE